jgi:alpha-D-xyloside xylohydrolase
MKFSDGLWLNQRGFDVSYAVQAYDVTTTKNSIKIFATSSAIWNRAMTLGGVAFEITYTAVAHDPCAHLPPQGQPAKQAAV